MKLKKIVVSLFAAGMVASPFAHATNGMLMEGYGPIATGMGGGVVFTNAAVESVLGRRVAPGNSLPEILRSADISDLDGKPVMQAQWGPSVSKNPYLAFKVKGGKAGDGAATETPGE